MISRSVPTTVPCSLSATNAWEEGGQSDIFRATLEEDRSGSVDPVLETSSNLRWPSLSPDGSWLVYGNDESVFSRYLSALIRISMGGDGKSVQGAARFQCGRVMGTSCITQINNHSTCRVRKVQLSRFQSPTIPGLKPAHRETVLLSRSGATCRF